MTDQEQSEAQKPNELIDLGSNLVGALLGAGVGGLLVGPEGVYVGAGVGATAPYGLRKLIDEFSRRVLGQREKARVGAVIILAGAQIQEKLGAGQKLREDGFFESQVG